MSSELNNNFLNSTITLLNAINFIRVKILDNVNEDEINSMFLIFFKTFLENKDIGADVSNENINNFLNIVLKIFERVNEMKKPKNKNEIMNKYKGIKTQFTTKQFFKKPIFKNFLDILLGNLDIQTVSSISVKAATIVKTEMTKDEELQFYLNSPNYSNADKMLYPCSEEYCDAFIQNFELLGEKKDTGAFLDSIDTLRIAYKKALFYYYEKLGHTANSIKNMDPFDKFKLFYSAENTADSLQFINYVRTILKNEIKPDSRNPFDQIILKFVEKIESLDKILNAVEKLGEFKVFDKKNYIAIPVPINYGFKPEEKLISIENDHLIIQIPDISYVPKDYEIHLINTNEVNETIQIKVTLNYGIPNDELLIRQNVNQRVIGRYLSIGTMNVFTSIFICLSEQMDSITNVPDNKNCFENVIKPGLKSFDPYWFQRECIELSVTRKKNLILSGPTGGGKTHLLMFIVAKIIISMMGGTEPARIVFCLPSEQLVFQNYANTIKSFPKLFDNIVIITKSIAYKKENIMRSDISSLIVIGTPKELRDFFVVRDNNILSSTNDYVLKLKNYVDSERLVNINFLVVDEVHTLSRDYTSGINTLNEIKAIEELISCVDSEKGRIICASASLSEYSKIKLLEKIKNTMRRRSEQSLAPEIELISYNLEDIGETTRPTVYRFPGLPQQKFPVCVSGLGAIYKAESSEELIQINVTPKFIFNLLLKAKAEGVLPMALFFMFESGTVSVLRSLIDFMKEKILRSEWTTLKINYNRLVETTSRENADMVYRGLLKDKIIELSITNESVEESDIIIPTELYTNLIVEFNKYSQNNLTSFRYTPDLYAFLTEYVNNCKGLSLFMSLIHPFYTFGSIKTDIKRFDIKKPNGTLTLFGQELLSQGIDIDNCSHLINLLTESFTFGIGLVTSSIPVAIQLEIAKMLKEIKDSKNSADLGAVFCDYQMSMGVDYSFLSIAIIMMNLTDILYSLFLQMNGRCGRPTKNMRKLNQLPKAITFTVNVSNALTFPDTENLTFDTTGIKTNFYNSTLIYENVLSLMTKFEVIRHSFESKKYFSDESFYSDEILFPGISAINELHLKYFHMKRELKELYDIFKVAAPVLTDKYIKPLFYRFQFQCYNTLMSQSR